VSRASHWISLLQPGWILWPIVDCRAGQITGVEYGVLYQYHRHSRPFISLSQTKGHKGANNADEAGLIMDTALQTAAYSARAAIHGSPKITPGALVFHRDMILNIPLIADLELLRQ
jgi:hypothetical protein